MQMAGTESEVAAQVEVQVHVCIVVGVWATDSWHGKRSGGTGRGACACGHSGGWVSYR